VFGSAVNGPTSLSQAIWKYPNMVDPLKISLVEKFVTVVSYLLKEEIGNKRKVDYSR
jgi:hypothetical protein